jgi:cysteinyl-tRNA synthetase
MLKLHNTLTRSKQDFKPIQPNKVRMYVCGMTVYDFCHLGHARVMVVFDMVARWLRASGYEVTYVRNITDIDDKIIKRASENNESIQSLTQRFIEAMDEDSAKLGIIRPDIEPRATEHVQGMLDMISQLIAKDFAYQADNGDVFYKVRSFNDYGKLSGKTLDDLRAGERVDVDGHKHDPLDFVLWKSAKAGEPYWESPWGNGRPGWHIECSAMSAELLGEHFDIHGGGQDLQFPHHENEIAQSEATHGCTMANYWLHNGFVRVDDEKMSKSLGNFFTIREVLSRLTGKYNSEDAHKKAEKRAAEIIRYFILRAHYRNPLNYSFDHLEKAEEDLKRLYTALRDVSIFHSHNSNATEIKLFTNAMNDDFNTAEAFKILFTLVSDINKAKATNPDLASEKAAVLRYLAGLLGLLGNDDFLQSGGGSLYLELGDTISALDETMIEEKISRRNTAKQAKNYSEADRIRNELTNEGIILEDTPQGTTWRRA